jgi:hypothetical protein
MTPARRVALDALGGLALAGGAVALLLSRDGHPGRRPHGRRRPPPPSHLPHPTLRPAATCGSPGRVLTWTFTLEERSTVRVPRQNSPPRPSGTATLAIQGRLQWIRARAPNPAAPSSSRSASPTYSSPASPSSGQPLPVQPGDFNGQSALARYDADGALRTVEVTPGASPVFANITERMLQQVQAPWPNTPNTPTWNRDITGGLGPHPAGAPSSTTATPHAAARPSSDAPRRLRQLHLHPTLPRPRRTHRRRHRPDHPRLCRTPSPRSSSMRPST